MFHSCYNPPMCDMDTVVAALSTIRAPRTVSEYDLHALVARAFLEANLSYRHEEPIAPRRRIDFLCASIGVEVKRGKPASAPLLRQLSAYAGSDRVAGLVLVADRPPRLPEKIAGKPLRVVSLGRLWGIAL